MEYIIPQPPTIMGTSLPLIGQFFKPLKFTFINLFKHNTVIENGNIELPRLNPKYMSLNFLVFLNQRFKNKTFCCLPDVRFSQSDGKY